MGEGIAVSVLVLAAGSFTIIGASAVAPLIKASLGLTEVGVGAIASVAYLGALVTAPVAGRVTDRSGPAIVIIAGLLALAAGNLVAGSAVHAVLLYLGILIAGFGYGAVNPATTVLSNPPDARRRAFVMSIKQAGVPAGGIVAGATLPVVAQALGWRWAFVVSFALCLVLCLAIIARGGYSARERDRQARPHFPRRRLRLPVGFIFGLVIAGVQVSIFAFTSVYLVDARGLSAAAAGLGVSALLFGGVVGRLFWGWLSDRFSHHRIRLLEGIGALGAVLLVVLVLVPTSLVLVVLFGLGLCSVGWNGVYIAVVAESTDQSNVGRSMGVSLALINVGAIAFPLIVGAIVSLTGTWAVGLLALATLSLLSIAVVRLGSIHVAVDEGEWL